jgi:hypothetical protein
MVKYIDRYIHTDMKCELSCPVVMWNAAVEDTQDSRRNL